MMRRGPARRYGERDCATARAGNGWASGGGGEVAQAIVLPVHFTEPDEDEGCLGLTRSAPGLDGGHTCAGDSGTKMTTEHASPGWSCEGHR